MAAQRAGPPLQIDRRARANNRPGNRLAPWIAVEGSKLALVIAQVRTTWGRGEPVAEEIVLAIEVCRRAPVQVLEAADLEEARAD